jgi:integrase/recombinase XerD
MKEADGALIDEFADALWLADGLAKNTLAAYRSDLALFSLWLGEQKLDLIGADEAAINRYLAHLHARAEGFRPTSQRRLHSTLRRFYRWLLDQGRIRSDPLLNVERPRTAERFPKTLSEKQVEALLAAPDVNTRAACATARCWRWSTPPACASRN